MSVVSPAIMVADKPLTFASSIEDSIECEREEQDKFSLLADMPRAIQAHTLSFLDCPKEVVAAAKACKCFYKILDSKRNEMEEYKKYKEQIMPYFSDLILSIFSDFRDILKLKIVQFELQTHYLMISLIQ